MEGLFNFAGIIIIVFGILQIVLFFKLWGMTNRVNDIYFKIPSNKITIYTARKSRLKGKSNFEISELYQDALLNEVIDLYYTTKDLYKKSRVSFYNEHLVDIKNKYKLEVGDGYPYLSESDINKYDDFNYVQNILK